MGVSLEGAGGSAQEAGTEFPEQREAGRVPRNALDHTAGTVYRRLG